MSKRRTKRRSPRRTARRTTARRPRRAYRRNPPDIVGGLLDGALHSLYIVAGKAGSRIIGDLIPGLPRAGAAGLLVDGAAALTVGAVAEMVLPRDAASYVVAGALTGPIERAIVDAGVPVISPALAAYPRVAPLALAAYPSRSRLAAYPSPHVARASGLGMLPVPQEYTA